MIAYVDASALLRVVLRERGPAVDLRAFDGLVSSELAGVESLRTIDRLRLMGTLSAAEAETRGAKVRDWLDTVDLLLVRGPILSRASDPLPAPLGTLDAIHLVSALAWRDRLGDTLVVATHDTALGLAARAYGFEVVGL